MDYLTLRDIDQFDDLMIREIARLDKARVCLPVNRNVRFDTVADYHLTDRGIGLNGNQVVRLNTTVDDGSYDVVRIVSEQVRSDVATVAERYGKYVVYGIVGLIAFQLGKLWWRSRRKKG